MNISNEMPKKKTETPLSSVKVIPTDYREMLRLIAKSEAKGADPETAKIEAFYQVAGIRGM